MSLFSERPIMEHLSQHGFINYFGMQRFGTSNISTHKVFAQGVCTCRTFSTGCSKVIVRYTMLDIVLFIYLFGVLLFQSNLNSYILNFYPKVNPVTVNIPEKVVAAVKGAEKLKGFFTQENRICNASSF